MLKQADRGLRRSLDETEARGESRSDSSRGGVSSQPAEVPDPKVVARARRRRFTASYKLRILEEVEACSEAGAVGRILRREGLHSSHLTAWRKARHSGSIDGLEKKRGRRAHPAAALERKVVKLERENQRLRSELKKAETILDVQGKVAGLLGFNLSDGSDCS